jgi:glutathione S-transferase
LLDGRRLRFDAAMRDATRPSPPSSVRHVVWGSELSPFSLKLRALMEYAGIPYRWLPDDGSRLENYRAALLVARAKRARTAIRHPRMTDLDEYPLVPFLIENGRTVYYDSSALARWIDERHPPRHGLLFPAEPALGFVAQLIEEAFDEFGLYLVHHNRWVLSARTNDAGERLAHELRRILPPGTRSAFGRRFARRQVRRLPYLFSVAPAGFSVSGLAPGLTPPSRAGFPETHRLLDEAWGEYLDATEAILARQPYLLGERFTVADASAYGQLGMNLKDPTADEHMRRRAPVTHRWLREIRDGRHAGSAGTLGLSEGLRPLLAAIGTTFVPLMRRNEAAYEERLRAGETLFNEAAFDRGRALYDGELAGRPYRAVAKTFQVRVWREVREAWSRLPAEARREVEALAPEAELDRP